MDHPTSQIETFFLKAHYEKTVMRFFFVNIIKRRHFLLSIFDPTKKIISDYPFFIPKKLKK